MCWCRSTFTGAVQQVCELMLPAGVHQRPHHRKSITPLNRLRRCLASSIQGRLSRIRTSETTLYRIPFSFSKCLYVCACRSVLCLSPCNSLHTGIGAKQQRERNLGNGYRIKKTHHFLIILDQKEKQSSTLLVAVTCHLVDGICASSVILLSYYGRCECKRNAPPLPPRPPHELSFTPIEYFIFALCFRHRDFLMNKLRTRRKREEELIAEGGRGSDTEINVFTAACGATASARPHLFCVAA